jgi:hypothetical protein
MLDTIQRCFRENKVLYTAHARKEMRLEEHGLIREEEVYEAVLKGEIIKDYEDDQPYPSTLLYGNTLTGRPIHVVCAYCSTDDLLIIVTVYEPNPARWINYRRRRK